MELGGSGDRRWIREKLGRIRKKYIVCRYEIFKELIKKYHT